MYKIDDLQLTIITTMSFSNVPVSQTESIHNINIIIAATNQGR